MRTIAFAGLVEIEFPTRTVRLCDGGFFRWDGKLFRSEDEVFGTIGAVGELSEGVGEEVPVLEMQLLPPGATPPAQLSQPGFQSAPVRFWLAEYDPATGLVTGAPDLQFEGEVDQTTITFGPDRRLLDMTVVSASARLLERNIGNSLNATWHKSIWPGEAGHDQGTGLGRQIAWGVERPGGSGGGGRGFWDSWRGRETSR